MTDTVATPVAERSKYHSALIEFLQQTMSEVEVAETVAAIDPALMLAAREEEEDPVIDVNPTQKGFDAIREALSAATDTEVKRIAVLSVAFPLAAPTWMGDRYTGLAVQTVAKEVFRDCRFLHEVLEQRFERLYRWWREDSYRTSPVPFNVFDNTRWLASRVAASVYQRYLWNCRYWNRVLDHPVGWALHSLVYSAVTLRYVGDWEAARSLDKMNALVPGVLPLCSPYGQPETWIVVVP